MLAVQRVLSKILIFIFILAVTACGGGGGSSGTTSSTPFLAVSADNGQTGNELYKLNDAGSISLIKNINTNTSSRPRDYIKMNGSLYYSATDGIHGRELWKSDGTNALLVKDIYPGNSDSSPAMVAVVNNILFFVADDGIHGRELWKTDGTTAGTVLVADINPGLNSSSPAGRYGPSIVPGDSIVFNNELYFIADDGTHGFQLWKTNGTDTAMVVELNTGTNVFANSAPQNLTEFNGSLYFLCACNLSNGLWKSDGTATGTVPVTSIGNMSYPSPNALIVFNGALYFSGSDYAHGTELWKSDGTSTGAGLVKDINPGINSSNIRNLYVINNKLFFSADDGTTGQELWVSDGTDSGTSLVLDIYPGINTANPSYTFPNDSYPDNFTEYNGEAYFVANSGAPGYQLWKSDGTSNGTVQLTTLASSFIGPYGYSSLLNNSGTLYFSTLDTFGMQHLWKSNGTPAGTIDTGISLGSSTSAYFYFASPTNAITSFNNKLYLSISDGIHGFELYQSDGTVSGTSQIADINTTQDDPSSPYPGAWFNGQYYFAADDGMHGLELWKSDGTTNGTQIVKDINIGANNSLPMVFKEYHGMLYFFAHNPDGIGLWKTDGTADGTTLVCLVLENNYLNNQFGFIYPYYYSVTSSLIVYNDELYFTANDGVHGQELYKTDGVAITQVADINPGIGDSWPAYFTTSNGSLYFLAEDGTHGQELWKTDGTPQGTMLVKDISPGLTSTSLGNFTSYNGKLFFTAYTSDYGDELWSTNGTDAGTIMVKDINHTISPANSSNPNGLTVMGGILYFFADDGVNGNQLWRSDGTDAGTSLVKSIFKQNYFYNVPGAFNNKLYFMANDGNGDELWSSDGTDTGTVMLKNIDPAKINIDPYTVPLYFYPMFTEFNGRLFFMANDGVHGQEAWTSNGTSAGTHLIQDLNPGKNNGVAAILF